LGLRIAQQRIARIQAAGMLLSGVTGGDVGRSTRCRGYLVE
jgi:hypothetical protein